MVAMMKMVAFDERRPLLIRMTTRKIRCFRSIFIWWKPGNKIRHFLADNVMYRAGFPDMPARNAIFAYCMTFQFPKVRCVNALLMKNHCSALIPNWQAEKSVVKWKGKGWKNGAEAEEKRGRLGSVQDRYGMDGNGTGTRIQRGNQEPGNQYWHPA